MMPHWTGIQVLNTALHVEDALITGAQEAGMLPSFKRPDNPLIFMHGNY